MIVHPLFNSISEKQDLWLHHSFTTHMTNDENAPLGDYTGPLGRIVLPESDLCSLMGSLPVTCNTVPVKTTSPSTGMTRGWLTPSVVRPPTVSRTSGRARFSFVEQVFTVACCGAYWKCERLNCIASGSELLHVQPWRLLFSRLMTLICGTLRILTRTRCKANNVIYK